MPDTDVDAKLCAAESASIAFSAAKTAALLGFSGRRAIAYSIASWYALTGLAERTSRAQQRAHRVVYPPQCGFE